MAWSSDARLSQVLSMSMEFLSPRIRDLVSNANALSYTTKEKGMWKTFEGPRIRATTQYDESGTYTRYNTGTAALPVSFRDIFGDAEWLPKHAVVALVVTGPMMRENKGKAAKHNLLTSLFQAAERELMDSFDLDSHSDGAATDQIGGAQKMMPTTVSTGTYGSISRVDNVNWRPFVYNVHSDIPTSLTGTATTQWSSTTARAIIDYVMARHSRGKKGPDLILLDTNMYIGLNSAMVAIQRITDENSMGKLGFRSLEVHTAGRKVSAVLEGGIGSNMPSDTAYFIDTDAICWRYDADLNFEPLTKEPLRPVSQDAMVQHIGFRGEWCMEMPLHCGRVYDGTPGS